MLDRKANWQISSPKVILISADGKNLGITSKDVAINEARKLDLDLVQVSDPKEGYPICRITDFGKIKYEESKKNKSHHGIVKEVWVGYNSEDHDIQNKTRQVIEFLNKKYKVIYGLRIKKSYEIRAASDKDRESKLRVLLENFKDLATWREISTASKKTFTTLHPK